MSTSPEIEKFNHLASEWWDINGALKTLHDINPTRLQYIKNHCDINNAVVLDLGCGGGILSESLAGAAQHVNGLDLSNEAIAIAEQHSQMSSIHNLDYFCESADSHRHTHKSHYDVIVCMEMLEHVEDPESIIQACNDMLKPGGTLFLSTIHRKAEAYLKTVFIAEYLFRWIPPGTHDYRQFIKPSELAQMCRDHHLQLERIDGLAYEPFSRKAYITDKTNLNYLLVATKQS